MQRGDLSDLNTFLAISDHLSFRAAAAQLGVSASALSHSIRQLEERMGVKLLHRTSRSVTLTDSGVRLLERLRPGMEQISSAVEELKQERHRPSGRLRILAQSWAARTVIAPVWQRFLSSYPEVHLELCIVSTPIDTAAAGFDAGLAVRSRVPAEAIAVRVSKPKQITIVASPTYLSQHSTPRTPDDLSHHQCVAYRMTRDGEIVRWTFERNGKKKLVSCRGNVTVNDAQTSVQAAVDGLGLAYTIEDLAQPFLASGQLVRVLKDWSPTIEGLCLYYQGRRHPSAALRAFIDMIRTPDASVNRSQVKNPL